MAEPTSSTDLRRESISRTIERTTWSELLSDDELTAPPSGGPTCLDALDLAPGRWIAVVADDAGHVRTVPLVEVGSDVRRARPGDGVAEALLAMFDGDDDGTAGTGFVPTVWHMESVADERAVSGGQTNESWVVGERAVVKWAVRASAGPHPAVALMRELTSHGFTATPRPWATLEWAAGDAIRPRLLASVTELVPDATDGFTWAVDLMGAGLTSGDWTSCRDAAHQVGELVAAFHLALRATRTPATAHDLENWRSGAEADLDRALQLTTGGSHELLAHSVPAIRGAWSELHLPANASVMLVHGDLHVGQVLQTTSSGQSAYHLMDFDGNPVVDEAERTARQPAALDVAGMAQSLVHAGLVLHDRDAGIHDRGELQRLTGVMIAHFLTAYRSELATAHASEMFDDALVRAFRYRQVCREYIYAVTHLPRWLYVPDGALPALVAEYDG